MPPVDAAMPSWVTPELLRSTRETWQPYYEECLTDDECLSILLAVGRLIDDLGGRSP